MCKLEKNKYWLDNTSTIEKKYIVQLNTYTDNKNIKGVLKHVKEQKKKLPKLISLEKSLLSLYDGNDKHINDKKKLVEENEMHKKLYDGNYLLNTIEVLSVIIDECGGDTPIQHLV